MEARKFLPLDDLVIWSDNPRHGMQLEEGETYSEDEVINILIDVVGAKRMFNLIRDIFAMNGLMGSVVPVVVERGGKYYVYDGNRRVSALKLLRRPSIIEDSDLRKDVEDLVGTADLSFATQVFVYITSTQEAIELMDRTHNGEQDGVGLIPWEAYQRDISLARRQKDPMYPAAYCAARVLGYLKKREFKIPYTDLDRLFGSRALRECFGIREMTDEYADQIREAEIQLLQYRSEKRFRSFSRQFNTIDAGKSDGPIQQFCRWVTESRRPQPSFLIAAESISLFANQQFQLQKLKIEVRDSSGNPVVFEPNDLSIAFRDPQGRECTSINTGVVGKWGVVIGYHDASGECSVDVKGLMSPLIQVDDSKLEVQKGSTLRLSELVIRALDGHGADRKDDISISPLDGASVANGVFLPTNEEGEYRFSIGFTDVDGAPHSVVAVVRVVTGGKALSGTTLSVPLLCFPEKVSPINISAAVNHLVNEINSLVLADYKCVISSSLRSLVELAFDELQAKGKIRYSANDLLVRLKETKEALKNGLLREICSKDPDLSFQTEKNVLEQMNPDSVASLLHLGAHKSAVRIDLVRLSEVSRKTISSLLVYISTLLS